MDRALAVDAVLMPGLSGNPDGAPARCYPCPLIGLDRKNPRADIDELMIVVAMARDDVARGVKLLLGRRDRLMADFRHKRAACQILYPGSDCIRTGMNGGARPPRDRMRGRPSYATGRKA